MSEPIEVLVLHVPRSEDGQTGFARAADILDHLATVHAYDPYLYGFFITRAEEARKIEEVMQREVRSEKS